MPTEPKPRRPAPRPSKLARSPDKETAPGERGDAESNFKDKAYRDQREAYDYRSHENYPANSAQRKEEEGDSPPGDHPDGTPERRRRSQT